MQSKLFKKDFLQFIDNKVKQVYLEKIPKKLNSIRIFITKMDKKKQSQESRGCYFNIESYFWKNKQCKLPWSFAEIDDAIESIKLRLNKAQIKITALSN